MRSEPIEEAYFNWLCAKVLHSDLPNSNNYRDLLRILYQTEFVWVILGDRNRAADGIDLRLDFLRETSFRKEQAWFETPASVFEVFLAFAQRASFQTDMPVRHWFWVFMANMELDEYRRVSEDDVPDIEERLNEFIWRTYRDNGHGGMFPLHWPKRDQREVEIWYQFCDYLEDQDLV